MTEFAIQIKRVYEPPAAGDGERILVDRLWPRGLSKEQARIDYWVRDLAPSNELRRWYAHEPEKWPEFRRKYFAELGELEEKVDELLGHLEQGPVTFLFGSRESQLNNAHALKEYVESRVGC
jgi:uncharacterized protein YeaO (DUF488 family)